MYAIISAGGKQHRVQVGERLAVDLIRDKNKGDEIVFYFRDTVVSSASWEAAKALAWGYENVYHFLGGAEAWAEAGYPVETGD